MKGILRSTLESIKNNIRRNEDMITQLEESVTHQTEQIRELREEVSRAQQTFDVINRQAKN